MMVSRFAAYKAIKNMEKQGSNIRDSLGFANACGAICTTEVGAGTALKSRDQVIEFMGSHRLKE